MSRAFIIAARLGRVSTKGRGTDWMKAGDGRAAGTALAPALRLRNWVALTLVGPAAALPALRSTSTTSPVSAKTRPSFGWTENTALRATLVTSNSGVLKPEGTAGVSFAAVSLAQP